MMYLADLSGVGFLAVAGLIYASWKLHFEERSFFNVDSSRSKHFLTGGASEWDSLEACAVENEAAEEER